VLENFFSSGKANIIKEVCWCLSNLAAGTPTQAVKLIEHSVFERILFQAHHTNLELRKEALYVVSNAIITVDVIARERLLDLGEDSVILALLYGLGLNDQ